MGFLPVLTWGSAVDFEVRRDEQEGGIGQRDEVGACFADEFGLAMTVEECGRLFLGLVADWAGSGGDGVGLEAFLALTLRPVQGGAQAVGRAPFVRAGCVCRTARPR